MYKNLIFSLKFKIFLTDKLKNKFHNYRRKIGSSPSAPQAIIEAKKRYAAASPRVKKTILGNSDQSPNIKS